MNNKNVDFSVVIPAYNCADTIERVLNSVKSQTRFDLIKEIIIINDGSTDNTDDVIRDYIVRNPEMNIVYKTQNNRGVSITRNKGINISSGSWIALLDADDEWAKKKIEKQYNVIRSNSKIKFLGSAYPLRFLLFKKHGVYKVNPYELCIRSTPMTPTVVFERKTGIELGLFNEKRKYSEDIQFFQKFFLIDSYYILVDKLVNVSIGKKYFGEKGLSSNLKKMHIGRNENVKELYSMKLISKQYMLLMLLFNNVKYFRRVFLQKIKNLRNN